MNGFPSIPAKTSSTVAVVPPSIASIDWSGLIKQYNNPEGYFMLGALLVLLVMAKLLGAGKSKITTGRTVKLPEKLAAVSGALRQIDNIDRLYLQLHAPEDQSVSSTSKNSHPSKSSKNSPKRNQVTLWCGTPRYWFKHQFKTIGAIAQTWLGQPPTVYLKDMQRSALVLGIPGCGKTFSVIDRAIESTFVQGIPVIIYDKKGDQMRVHAPLAARYGYQVWVFAPGEPYSGVFNPIDQLKNERDSVMAGQIGQVINRNAREPGVGRGDEFFQKAGDQVAKALIQLAKSFGSDYADFATVYSILRLPNLVKRVDYAVQNKQIDEWVLTSFNQLLSAKDAEKTVSGILTTASALFSSFIQADLLRAFIGRSDIPTYIEGRQCIICKLDDERRSVVGPLVAATLTMLINGNLAVPRKDPILISLDELASLRLDFLATSINEHRSNGGCYLLGIQALEQLYEAYGDKMGASIAAACSTHILFNPGTEKTAEVYSKRYGEKEVLVRNRSISHSTGQHSNRSTSWSESLQRVPLFTVDEILKFPEGKCVITSPGYRSRGEGSIPYPIKIHVPAQDQVREKECYELWETQVRPALEKRVSLPSEAALTAALLERIDLVKLKLPLPEEAPTASTNQSSNSNILNPTNLKSQRQRIQRPFYPSL